MVFVWFALAAIVTVLSAVKLSTFADTIGEKTSLGGMIVGTVFLAGATSLPEVTTSISASILGNPDIAVGNIFGSNMFNLLILASFDLYYRKQRLFMAVDRTHFYTASMGLLLTIISLLALTIQLDYSFLGIGIDTWILIIFYVLGVLIISNLAKKRPTQPQTEVVSEASSHSATVSLKVAITGFSIAALVIMGTGTVLTIMGDKIAVITGLGSSFIGTFLIAATTSLPEAVAVYVALRLRNYNLAFGSILGSNIFNFLILAPSDFFNKKGTIFTSVSDVHQITAAGVGVLAIIVLYSLTRTSRESSFRYALPSFLLIILYIVSSYLIFIQ